MPVFIERFVLPILATVVMGVCAYNPWKWDLRQRISLGLAAILLAYFFAHTSYQSTSKAAQATARAKSGGASTSGNNSPAITGDGNNTTYDQSSAAENKPKPSK
jgi:hypothetical protein